MRRRERMAPEHLHGAPPDLLMHLFIHILSCIVLELLVNSFCLALGLEWRTFLFFNKNCSYRGVAAGIEMYSRSRAAALLSLLLPRPEGAAHLFLRHAAECIRFAAVSPSGY